MKERIASIDVLKFLAAIAITNSHMDMLYDQYAMLAKGGAIGNAIFFFISGFTIFIGSTPRFDNWYKRRINRIYPSIFAWAILSCVFWGENKDMLDTVLFGGGWFVSCIMLYYLLLYPIKRFCHHRLWYVFIVFCIINLVLFLVCGYKDNLYNGLPYFNYSWSLYFLFMLFGAIVGTMWKDLDYSHSFRNLLALIVCIIIFYSVQAFFNSALGNTRLSILSIPALFGIVFYLFKVCNAKTISRLVETKIAGFAIKAIGGVCLEIYIVQSSLFTAGMNNIFPLNIIVMFLIIFSVAYLLRCCARFFSQTFKEADYDWKEIIKVI